MKSFFWLAVLFLIVLNTGTVLAQPKLMLSVDYSRYRGDSVNTYLEIYYSYSEYGLQLKKTPDGFKSSVIMTVQVLNLKKDSVIEQKRWRVPRIVADTAGIEPIQGLVGTVNMGVPQGEYFLRICGQDENLPSNVDTLIYTLKTIPISESKTALSDLELCTSIKQSETKDNIFYKNTLEVIPNPSMLYGLGMPVIFYYIEAYNLLKDKESPNFYTRTSVVNASGKEIMHQEHRRKRSNESSVEVGTMNISKLPNGTYTLFFSLADSSGAPKISVGKKFFVYNPNIIDSSAAKASTVDVLSSEFATMTEEELDKEFLEATYLATQEEKDQYEEIKDLAGKKKFMFDFWRIRDSDPSTLINETKDEYLKRVEFANLNFRAISRSGYRTDRGRVYCVYGPPDEVERHPNEGDYRPYEIWHYNNLQGGVIFVFVDRSGFSDYQLVHSTHRNELQDENWQDKAQMVTQ